MHWSFHWTPSWWTSHDELTLPLPARKESAPGHKRTQTYWSLLAARLPETVKIVVGMTWISGWRWPAGQLPRCSMASFNE